LIELFKGFESEKEGEFVVYHDESGTIKGKGRWFFTGLLFVPLDKLEEVKSSLNDIKIRYGCISHEIHFANLPKRESKYGYKVAVAEEWLKWFKESDWCKFSVLALDKKSPTYEPERFPKDFFAYNRFTVMALKAGISWFLKDEHNSILLTMISDEKSRKRSGIKDNFVSYIPNRLEEEYLDSVGFKVEFRSDCVILESSKEEIMLQFCDVLLGAIAQAVAGTAIKESKIELARIVLPWLYDIRKEPWKQKFGLHKKLNLWYFPDQDGGAYTHGPLLLEKKYQPDLFTNYSL